MQLESFFVTLELSRQEELLVEVDHNVKDKKGNTNERKAKYLSALEGNVEACVNVSVASVSHSPVGVDCD